MPTDVEELNNRYQFSRHNFQLYISWFTVFSGLNIAVLGWVATSVFQSDEVRGFWLAFVLSIMFIFQNVLGIIGSAFLGASFAKTEKRISNS